MDPIFVLVITTVLSIVVVVAIALLLRWLLRWRGITMRRTRFGTTLIFDSADADGTPVRLLNVGGTFQSVCYLPEELHGELACAYHRTMAELMLANDTSLQVLVMGGGGYSLPKYLCGLGTRVHTEVVEVDPAITEIAREWFFLDEIIEKTNAARDGRLQIVHDDAWNVLCNAATPYDVIVNDAFSGKRPLGRLTSAEGVRAIASHLAENGLYLANVRCPLVGRKSRVLHDTAAAFARTFTHVIIVPEWPDKPNRPGNNVLAVSNAALPLPPGAIVVQ